MYAAPEDFYIYKHIYLYIYISIYVYRQKLKAAGGGEDGAPEAVHPAATNTDATNADIVAQKDAVGLFKSLEKKEKKC